MAGIRSVILSVVLAIGITSSSAATLNHKAKISSNPTGGATLHGNTDVNTDPKSVIGTNCKKAQCESCAACLAEVLNGDDCTAVKAKIDAGAFEPNKDIDEADKDKCEAAITEACEENGDDCVWSMVCNSPCLKAPPPVTVAASPAAASPAAAAFLQLMKARQHGDGDGEVHAYKDASHCAGLRTDKNTPATCTAPAAPAAAAPAAAAPAAAGLMQTSSLDKSVAGKCDEDDDDPAIVGSTALRPSSHVEPTGTGHTSQADLADSGDDDE